MATTFANIVQHLIITTKNKPMLLLIIQLIPPSFYGVTLYNILYKKRGFIWIWLLKMQIMQHMHDDFKLHETLFQPPYIR